MYGLRDSEPVNEDGRKKDGWASKGEGNKE